MVAATSIARSDPPTILVGEAHRRCRINQPRQGLARRAGLARAVRCAAPNMACDHFRCHNNRQQAHAVSSSALRRPLVSSVARLRDDGPWLSPTALVLRLGPCSSCCPSLIRPPAPLRCSAARGGRSPPVALRGGGTAACSSTAPSRWLCSGRDWAERELFADPRTARSVSSQETP